MRLKHCGKRRKCLLPAFSPFPIMFLKGILRQILDSTKLKELADQNFEYGGNGIESSKRVENTVGEGEIACYKQFLLFPQCFLKTCTVDK